MFLCVWDANEEVGARGDSALFLIVLHHLRWGSRGLRRQNVPFLIVLQIAQLICKTPCLILGEIQKKRAWQATAVQLQ